MTTELFDNIGAKILGAGTPVEQILWNLILMVITFLLSILIPIVALLSPVFTLGVIFGVLRLIPQVDDLYPLSN